MKKILSLFAIAVVLVGCNSNKKDKEESLGDSKENIANQQKEVTSDMSQIYADRGLKYALTTQTVLGKNLMEAIQNDGVVEALAFCNEKAYPLTDSMAVVHKATLKRVTDQPRNPKNQANHEELGYIENFKKLLANNEEVKPVVIELQQKVKVFYPITTNPMCLQCHGKPNETIEQSTLTAINGLYPNDKAIGYNINEVRGLWSVIFDK